ncbi:MAG: hypothetical protein ACOYMN_04455, partial [Roseimicrobium sp.]
EALEKMPGKNHGMVIFSDGQETDSAMMEEARNAVEKGLRILPVGIGTADGALIPDPDPQYRGDWLRDENGNVINSRLETSALQELAKITGGEFIELNARALTQQLVSRLLEDLDKHQAEAKDLSRPIERYQWPLFLGILFIVMSLLIRPSSQRASRLAPLPTDPKATVHHPPPVPRATLAVLIILMLGGQTWAASKLDLEGAHRAFSEGRYEAARDAYRELSHDKGASAEQREGFLYGLGAAALQLKDYDVSERAFSDALQSTNTDLQRRAQRGLATSLYNHGATIMAKEPEATIKAWTDARDHFDSAMKRAADASQEFTALRENRDFVQQKLDELKKQQQQKKQKGKSKDKKKGQGQGEGDPEEQEGGEESSEEEQQQAGDKDGSKKTDAMQKNQGALPEGELRAGEPGKAEKEQQQAEGSKEGKETDRNDKTGFSPMEARSQLRNYADDQKSVQYLMRKERPQGGKDY